MKQICPKSYERTKVKAAQFHIFPLCLCYFFLPFVCLTTTHTLTPERGWAREQAREHARACEGIDRWSIIRHEQPKKVGQGKDRAHGICLNLKLSSDWRRWMSGTWGCSLFECCSLCCVSQWPAGVWWWALPWDLSDPSCLSSWMGTHYITERPRSKTVRPQTLHLVLLRPQFPHL